MWIIATEDLKLYLPDTAKGARRTQVDITSKMIPRLFETEDSAAKALGHWFKGPYQGFLEEGGWYYNIKTDPNRRAVWGELLAPRKIKVTPA